MSKMMVLRRAYYVNCEADIMTTWNWISSSHSISEIRDWSNALRLEIRPDFQRKEVWLDAAMLAGATSA